MASTSVQISEAGLAGVPLPSRAFDLWNIGPALQWELDVWEFRRRIEQRMPTSNNK
jgi:hypothetical protein